ncbi:predicted protein [Nematostella vectensis]|uniref:Uncharacterized protein n=1 Tax=Nematostella vectensis TaxID=45351 RepID=A7RUV3_NEMVE|nr:predicted protein [Nematostella vectensis]|eukprot:XP_001636821.1 predicted protein [Nematostella vectensis]
MSLPWMFLVTFSCLYQVGSSLTCNGRAAFCDLTLNQATFAGTHNSASGFDGFLHYHTPLGPISYQSTLSLPGPISYQSTLSLPGPISYQNTLSSPGPIVALSCFYRNQHRSITGQLDDGIRYLDIDTCWEDSSRYTKGAWACHEGAYAGPVYKILNQVDAWMRIHRNEVVVINFNRDTVTEDAEKTGQHITKLIEERWGVTAERQTRKELMVNDYRRRNWHWPTLGEAVMSNQRIFVFMTSKLIHHRGGTIGMSWKSYGLIESKGCSKLVEYIREKCDQSYSDFMQIDLILTWGLCVDDMAYFCNRYTEQITQECAERRAKTNRMTANFILVDYQSEISGSNRVGQVALRQNIRNVKSFLGKDIS